MVAIIAALSKNGVIGKNGSIPWRIPADMAYFKKVTTGSTIIMGRKTYESIGRPLPDRFNIVISSTMNYQADNCITVSTFEKALALAGEGDVFICGGASVYEKALPYAGKLYLTEIDILTDGDTFFPYFDKSKYRRTVISEHYDDYKYRFVTYDKIV